MRNYWFINVYFNTITIRNPRKFIIYIFSHNALESSRLPRLFTETKSLLSWVVSWRTASWEEGWTAAKYGVTDCRRYPKTFVFADVTTRISMDNYRELLVDSSGQRNVKISPLLTQTKLALPLLYNLDISLLFCT